MTFLPPRINRDSGRKETGKRCPSHRKWVRGHACSVCGDMTAIECAHVRTGTDGAMGMKPSDKWCISLCKRHHEQQHQYGERQFEKLYKIDMKAMAAEFFKRSPHRHKLEARDDA